MDNGSKNLSGQKATKKRKNIFIFTFLSQLIVCIIIIFGLFLTKIFFNPQYVEISKKISFALKDSGLKNFIDDFLISLKGENNSEKKEQSEEKQKNNIQKEKATLTCVEENFNGLCSSNDDDVIFFTFKQPLEGKITSKYGKRENPISKGTQDFHYGVDILAKDNTPVASIADGVVELTASSKKSGNFVLIRHGEFYESLYAHCNKILVNKGRFVKKGEQIALSGHTGDTTGAHLHLGIKKNGSWINPSTVFPNLI